MHLGAFVFILEGYTSLKSVRGCTYDTRSLRTVRRKHIR